MEMMRKTFGVHKMEYYTVIKLITFTLFNVKVLP